MSTAHAITADLEVWQPNGDIAYRADQAEVDRLLRTKAAKPQFGRDKKLKALRLKEAIPVRAEADSGPVQQDGRHIPVIRMRELLAPSPRRNYGSVRAVHHNTARVRPQGLTTGQMRYVRKLDKRRRVKELERKAAEGNAEREQTRRA